jgi:catechol 2,3-dioxygenase-like lactoylglutathione lyase family enzyme
VRYQEPAVKKLQVQGVHHITIVGSTKQSAIDFWEGVLGMPFVLEQPNLGKPDENHLYFDPGDGRLLTVFTNEAREDAGRQAPREIGCVEHLAFNVSRATFTQAPARLRDRGIDFIQRDRGFMDSIYLHDPNGLKVELACYKFEPPEGFRAVDVLITAQSLRVERGDHHITDEHLADAIELLMASRSRLRTEQTSLTPV